MKRLVLSEQSLAQVAFWRKSFWQASPAWGDAAFRKRFFWVCYGLVILALVVKAFFSNFALTLNFYPDTCIPKSRVMLLDLRGFASVREFQRGDVVSFKVDQMQRFFPKETIYAKYVGGVEGDRVVVKDGVISVNGKQWGKLALVSMKKLPGPMSRYDRALTVGKDELLMLGTQEKSYDGRYWGVVKKEEIIGRAHPIF